MPTNLKELKEKGLLTPGLCLASPDNPGEKLTYLRQNSFWDHVHYVVVFSGDTWESIRGIIDEEPLELWGDEGEDQWE